MEKMPSLEINLHDLLNNVQDVIFTISVDGKITSLSKGFEITGYSVNEWIGKDFKDLVHPDDLSMVFKRFQTVLKGEKSPPNQARVLSKTGEILTFEVQATPYIRNGQIIGYLGISRDITRRKKTEEKLKSSEQLYRTVINSLGDPIHLINEKMEIILINPALATWLSSLGLNHQIVAKSLRDAFPFLPPKVFDQYEDVLANGKTLLTEEATPINGKIYITETRKIPIYREKSVIQVLTVIRDVTNQKKTERALRESEERYKTFINAATDAFSLWDSDLNLLDINEVGLNLFPEEGRKKEFLIGKNLADFAKKTSSRTRKNISKINQVLKTGKPFIQDDITPPSDFGNKIISVKAFKVGDGLGIINSDVTERKKIEKTLKENEEKFRNIFEFAPIGMVLTDPNSKFIKVNRAFTELLGYSEEELTGMSLSEVTHPYHRKRDQKYTEKLIKGERAKEREKNFYQTEKRYLKKDGGFLWSNTTVSLQRDEKGGPKYFTAMIDDITAAKTREEEIKRQLLKYNVQDGYVYLIDETSPSLSGFVLDDLSKIGYQIFIASRTPKEVFASFFQNHDYLWINEDTQQSNLIDFIKRATAPPKSVILISRLEYLILRDGFKKTVKFLYKIRDMAYEDNLIIILSVDYTTLEEREKQILEQETQNIEPRITEKLSEESLEILRYIYEENTRDNKPSYSEVGERFEISRPTTRKRIEHLLTLDYLVVHKIGKTKKLQLSNKGISLFITE